MKIVSCLCLLGLLVSCHNPSVMQIPRDIHSYSNPQQVRVRHVDLDLDVSFETKRLRGAATLTVERNPKHKNAPLVVDSRDLVIEGVEAGADALAAVKHEIGQRDPILGAPLTIQLPPDATRVRIRYATNPQASALQWLDPAQTAGGQHPFLYTQSQAIHARSWIPLQDTPGVRVTYSAKVRTPPGLTAVMSAAGSTTFRMTQPVPSYLIALAVGDLRFRPMSPRTGVWAEPGVVDAAAHEFEDTESMIRAAEEMYGPYRWERYDILVLPPSFPFGGMENPRLTFATPTILAGDKSLVSLVAHELAHSWSGNLVTNATWSDFWLNEGFTVYIEQRIQEKVFGARRAAMEAVLELESLKREFATLPEKDQILHIDLSGRDPDDGVTEVPYVKGALLLRAIEESAGRAKFDAFLRSYFDHFAFRSITTEDFTGYLEAHLPVKVPLDEWIYRPGLPQSAVLPSSDALQKVEEAARKWADSGLDSAEASSSAWTTQEWRHFLESLPKKLDGGNMEALDRTFRFTSSRNSEILQPWLLISIRNRYKSAYPRLEDFLVTVGRRKYLKPLYEEMAKSPEGLAMARSIYAKARPGYHSIAASTIDEILRLPDR